MVITSPTNIVVVVTQGRPTGTFGPTGSEQKMMGYRWGNNYTDDLFKTRLAA
jgi:hypothetical protein